MAEFLDNVRDKQQREAKLRQLMQLPISEAARTIQPTPQPKADQIGSLIERQRLNELIQRSLATNPQPQPMAAALGALPKLVPPPPAPVAQPQRPTTGVQDRFISNREVDANKPVESLGNYSIRDIKNYLIPAESGGNTNAISRANAHGLMQLQPATAKEQAERMGLPWLGTSALRNNPQYNVKLGTGYLSHLTQRFGDTRLALAAYNWGPSALQNLIERKGTSNFEALFRHMPEETRKYVNRIIGGVNSTRTQRQD